MTTKQKLLAAGATVITAATVTLVVVNQTSPPPITTSPPMLVNVVPGGFQFTEIKRAGTNVILRWKGGGNNLIQVQTKTNAVGSWANIGAATTNTVSTNPVTAKLAFYRLVYTNAPAMGAWSHSYGGFGNDGGQAMAGDATGTVLAGYFNTNASFGGSNFVSAGGSDVFLARYDNAGAHQWSRRYGGAANEEVRAVALDSFGSIYLCGTFYSGSTSLGGSTLTNAGQYDCFLAKYSSTGVHLWSKAFGGTGRDLFTGIMVDADNSIIVSGTFQSAYPGISFGGDPIYTQGPAKIVLAKYLPDGTHVWSKVFPSGAANTPYAIARVGSDFVLAGSFNFSVDFGCGNLTSPSAQFEAMFLARFDGSGTCLWSKRYGSDKVSKITALGVDPSGDIVAGSFFYTKTDLGNGLLTGTGNDNNIALAKYSGADGSFVWGRVFDGNNGAYITGVNASGNITLTGYFYGTLNLGLGNITSTNLGYDVFLATYTATGSPLTQTRYGGGQAEQANALIMDATGKPVITGGFQGAAEIGGSLNAIGGYDAFLVKP